MNTKEKEELFKLEVENLSLLEGREVKGGGEAGTACSNPECEGSGGTICSNGGCDDTSGGLCFN